ncbi:putative DNA-binding protein [Paenalkalicoccus suaedae]|uniref:UPF0122 protein FLK61_32710 n=1 Tax=Paenalkalicoccus suaedae TaxID=2592382 RepID=A0A859FGX8_9BACI|nr:putative DNA-binding protein [Paenalkalicoccus suaedae]QKS71465.1 putative DNA-binding protein [Paenalkalicoccus suaedae]
MIEKTVRMNYLFDFYQSLLTDKQRHYMDMYYLDDWSLGEIAEHYNVSRQAIYDNIRRTEAMLEEYEAKLALFSKYDERKKLMESLKELIEEEDTAKLREVVTALENLE